MKIKEMFRLNNMKLQKKLLLSYIFLVLLPIIITGFFLVYRTIRTTMNSMTNISQISFSQMETNITNMLEGYLKLADSVTFEKRLMDYIGNNEKSNDYIQLYKDYNDIYAEYSVKFPIAYGNIFKMSIYTTNSTIIKDNVFIISIDDNIRKQQWYKDVCESHGLSIFLEPHINNGTYYITIGKQLNPFAISRYTNIVLLEIPEAELYQMIEKEGANKNIYILNDDNLIVSSTDRNSLNKNTSSVPGLSEILEKKPVNGYLNLGSSTVFCDFIQITDSNNWKIISVVSNEPVYKSIANAVYYGISICCISVIITVVFLIFLSNTLTKRLKMLVKNMSNIRGGKFDVFVEYDGRDEISDLYGSFKSMVDRINVLINEVYLLDIEKKDAEIKALQSQMNPHFLFNTMESIRMNLWNKKDYVTSEVIQKFAKLLRKSIDWSESKISLQQEIDLAETYLKIQQYRYGDKFEYSMNIDKALYDCVIPKFTLQPIVENAIYHGIEMKKGSGRLMLYSAQSEADFTIIVEDDGVGIGEDRLTELQWQLCGGIPDSGNPRIGIINVHKRIRFYYGNEYGISIESSRNIGTIVRIALPKRYI